ncbi:DUF397 domain-containing protein [Streptomyces poonensis]|uniref:DUF397 domain-containing protein n=1 Tax=Streptomyces poonensis TaxID=68255 RepID=UPI0016793716|nr:DUF397 domain-containing protein [Streptomyces poonensis]
MSFADASGPGRLVWFTSSYSNGAGGECVECAMTEHGAFIRDSKCPEMSVLSVSRDAWRLFLQVVQHGQPTT